MKDFQITATRDIGPDERRRVLSVSVALSEAEVHWRSFLDDLVANQRFWYRQTRSYERCIAVIKRASNKPDRLPCLTEWCRHLEAWEAATWFERLDDLRVKTREERSRQGAL